MAAKIIGLIVPVFMRRIGLYIVSGYLDGDLDGRWRVMEERQTRSQPSRWGGGVWTWMGGTPPLLDIHKHPPPPLDIARVTSSIFQGVCVVGLGHCPVRLHGIQTFGHKTFGHKVAGTTFGHSMKSSL